MTKTRFVAAMVAVPLLLAACGDGSGSSTTSTSVNAAQSSSSSPGGAPATDIGSAQPGQDVDTAAFVEAVNKGTAAAKTYAMQMKMDTSGDQSGTITMDGEADVSDQANPKMKMTMEIPGAGGASSAGSIEMLLIDKAMFMKMPGSAGKYFTTSVAEMAKLSGQDLTQAMNPTAQLETMKSSIKKVTYVGEEDLDGVTTRHYKALIDTAKVAPSGTATSLPSSASLPAEMPYEMWLDDEHRTRKFTMNMAVGTTNITYDGTLDKFGEPFNIAAPPASQVQPMPKSALPNG